MSHRGRGRGRGGGGIGRSNVGNGDGMVDFGAMEGTVSIVNRSQLDRDSDRNGRDMYMGGGGGGPNSGGGRGRGRSNPYGAGQRRGTFGNMTMRAVGGVPGALPNEVSVFNWNDKNSDPVSLISFIAGKTNPSVNVQSHRIEGNEIFLKLRTPHEVTAVSTLNGIRYAGAKLLIKNLNIAQNSRGPPGSGGAPYSDSIASKPEVVSLLTQVLQSRYNEDGKFLNLENLAAHPGMSGNASLSGFGGDAVETIKIGPVICKLIKETFPDVQSINFQSNRLSSMKPFETLYIFCPFIQNLSFQDNLIQNYRDLESLRGEKLKNLRELLLMGNPVHDREARKGEAGVNGYRTKIKQLFPSIKVLDMVPFEEEVALPEIGLPSVEELPQTIKGAFTENQVIADLIQEFIPKFFGLFDANRPRLADVYTDTSLFSISVNPNNRRQMGQAARPVPVKHSSREIFDTWLGSNRNHITCRDPSRRLTLLGKGPQEVQSLFMKLPQTKHPINASFEKAMFVVDAFQQQIGDASVLVVTINGELDEVAMGKSRSFTRTFILAPAAEGSKANLAGWKLCVVNDMLVIRSWAAERPWTDKPSVGAMPTSGPLVGLAHGAKPHDVSASSRQNMSLTGPSRAGALPSDVNVLLAFKNHFGLDDAKHNLVVQLAQATGLNYQMAGECLENAGWNGQAAIETFHAYKAQIPQSAFQFAPL
ncbi:hypothetical protein BJ741DRAFT_598756 [Chytriomyces cf. hyalinus JEL632]|nr:hypothetical protein BJ741DRAFT_598756 [Chytriomyces cf. hyalinus JEL632]